MITFVIFKIRTLEENGMKKMYILSFVEWKSSLELLLSELANDIRFKKTLSFFSLVQVPPYKIVLDLLYIANKYMQFVR